MLYRAINTQFTQEQVDYRERNALEVERECKTILEGSKHVLKIWLGKRIPKINSICNQESDLLVLTKYGLHHFEIKNFKGIVDFTDSGHLIQVNTNLKIAAKKIIQESNSAIKHSFLEAFGREFHQVRSAIVLANKRVVMTDQATNTNFILHRSELLSAVEPKQLDEKLTDYDIEDLIKLIDSFPEFDRVVLNNGKVLRGDIVVGLDLEIDRTNEKNASYKLYSKFLNSLIYGPKMLRKSTNYEDVTTHELVGLKDSQGIRILSVNGSQRELDVPLFAINEILFGYAERDAHRSLESSYQEPELYSEIQASNISTSEQEIVQPRVGDRVKGTITKVDQEKGWFVVISRGKWKGWAYRDRQSDLSWSALWRKGQVFEFEIISIHPHYENTCNLKFV